MEQDQQQINDRIARILTSNIGIGLQTPVGSVRITRPSFLLNTSLLNRGDLVNIVSESLEENKGIPKPMCKNFIESLKEKKITSEDDLSCAICQDKFKEDEIVIELPCKDGGHFFHFEEGECPGLKPWIEINNTCPVCRSEFPLEPETETEPEPETDTEEENTSESRRELAENIMEETFTNIMRSYIDRAFEEQEDIDLNEAIQRSLNDS